MTAQIRLGDIVANVTHKDIKNVHLSVYPPSGTVRISAPLRMDIDTIRIFALSKLGWIRKQQAKFQAQDRETPRDYIDRESHYLWGKRYLLNVQERDAAPAVQVTHSELAMQIRPGTTHAKRETVLEEWYRVQLKDAIAQTGPEWERKLGVTASRYIVQKMKTKWGSCNPASGIVRLNLDLAKKPPGCLEYILVHELLHLIEPTHNDRFFSLLNHHFSKWRFFRDELNRLPVRHENWPAEAS